MGDPPEHVFHSTHWSLVVAAAGAAGDEASRSALESFCRRYWYPIYAFVRRRGYDSYAAEDLTQSFFARLLDRQMLRAADPGRGRFRSFLLKSLDNYLLNERKRQSTLKRGGGHRILSIDLHAAEARYSAEPCQESSPQRAFDREWALTVLHQALEVLRDDYRADGKEHVFDALKLFLTADDESAPRYEDACAALKISPEAARAAVYRLRHRYKAQLREIIAQTLSSPDQVEDEIRDLFRALSPSR
jgi:RNA polymerase sigma-70 factor (ECF subfamily)